ncbi:transmembrane protein, putative [Medicago truncatula]|uniref:Glycerophosphocholine acyltransferase 1 n=1 Tax=Medicago truncatula TaxID=3880 RepID=G7IQ59_MEDTR|nr:transmembrane protein, putative [Medicago truncatula]
MESDREENCVHVGFRQWNRDDLDQICVTKTGTVLRRSHPNCRQTRTKEEGHCVVVVELSKKAKKANNVWWRLSGLLGDQNRLLMYIVLQSIFTIATMALTVPIFFSYKLHAFFQIIKLAVSVWNEGSFLLEVKEKNRSELKPFQGQMDQPMTKVK